MTEPLPSLPEPYIGEDAAERLAETIADMPPPENVSADYLAGWQAATHNAVLLVMRAGGA
jgi:hypothetical protein